MEIDLGAFQKAYLGVASLAPGFLIMYIRSLFITGRIPTLKEGLIYYVVVSAAYYAVAFPVYEWADAGGSLSLLIAFFVAPSGAGLLLGILNQKNITRKLFQVFGLNIVHSCPNSWDYVFGNVPEGGAWIILALNDGEKIYGFFGEESFASSESTNRDLYIENIAGNNFQLEERKQGVWLKEADILSIEMIPD